MHRHRLEDMYMYIGHSQSRYGLETQLKSLFYLFVRLYADLCTVTEHVVF